MPDTILVPIESMDIRLSGVPISKGLPITGTYMTITKVSGRTTMTEGLGGVLIFTAMAGTAYNVAISALQDSDADITLATAMRISQAASVLAFTYIHGKTTYTSPAVRFIDDPVLERATDAPATRVYTLGGAFPVTIQGSFGAPPVIEADQILAAIPE